MKLNFAQWQLKRSLARISAATNVVEAQLAMGRSRNVLSSFLAAATQEIRKSVDSSERGRYQGASGFDLYRRSLRAEARAVRQGMGLIATIGATAPFVGLFGTVWGIMNSFIGISKSQTTNLAVVAPGIAEALLATACGLAAAIPAVIIYNYLARTTRGYLDLVGRASGAVGRLLSRDLDRAHGRMPIRARRSESMGVSFDADIDDDDVDEMHEINVTPFIDVMLVLLIIFMVAAPLSTVDLPVDLPSSTAVPTKKPDKPIYVTIKADLVVAVDETPCQAD